jgi:hypothetical protein
VRHMKCSGGSHVKRGKLEGEGEGGNRRSYEIGGSCLKEKQRKWRVGRGLLMRTDEIKSLHGREIYNKMDLPPPPPHNSDRRFRSR